LSERDPITNKLPGTELELFDIEDPTNGSDLDRLDELYIEYRSDKLFAQAGRISFTSPLINPQDTRMKPYAAQGVHVQVPVQDKHQLTLAWLDHFSPRSTVEWVKAEESIGIYPTGVNPDGSPSEYEHHTNTKGVGIVGLKSNFGDRLQTEVWDYLIENVSNNVYGKANLALNEKLSVGLEGLYQNKVGTGGNEKEDKRYFAQENQWLIGSQLAYMPSSDLKLSLNYLHIGDEGRFLFPREWGREQFFVTQPRGRFEGSGKADVLNLRVLKRWSDNLSVEAGITKAWLPALQNFRANKYGQPSYLGFVLDANYVPLKPILDGLSFRLLYVGRTSQNVPFEAMY
ncbi:MAG: DUF2490 domain-containing protein, partial [Pontibacter sp.]|nr:DUF2490 domain-containing protein [Pontibacter sp.]